MRRHPADHPAAALLLGATLALAACGVDDEAESANPIEDSGTEVDGGNSGVDEAVTGDVTVADVELPYPADGVYRAGDDAPLSFAVTNTGTEPVTVEEITGEDFADARITGAGGGGASLEVPENDNLYVGAPDAPSVTLLDLEQDLRSSQSIPVTLAFADGSEVTVEAVVASTGGDVAEPDEDPTPDN